MKKRVSLLLTVAMFGVFSLTFAVSNPCACGKVTDTPTPTPTTSGGGFAFAMFGNGANFTWNNYVPPVIHIVQNGSSTTVTTQPGYFKNLVTNTNGKFIFLKDMGLGSSVNPDLEELQKVLVAENFLSVTSTKTIYDAEVRDAVAKFQKAHDIHPAPQYPYGFFGPLTRGYLNNRSNVVMN